MIIGETFKSDYDGYEEESYDYLFKRKASPARQQKKAEKKEKKVIKKQGRQEKRQDKKSGIAPKKRLIQGNFGMFNKNKKKEEAAKAALAEAASNEVEDPIPNEEANQAPEANADVGGNTDTGESGNESSETPTPSPDESNAAESEYDESEYDESEYDEGADAPKQETKSKSKDRKAKDRSGSMIGFAVLGLTALFVGYVIYSTDKRSKELLEAIKNAA